MKIQITGKKLPKYQWDFGSVGTQLDLSKIGVPNLQNIATVPFGINDKRDQYGNTITKDSQGKEITYDATGNPTSYKTHKNPINNDQVTKQQKNPFNYDYSTAQKMLTGMNFFNGLIQEGQGSIDTQYNKRLGMTDASISAVPNKSSHGNLLMNVGTPGNITTPVQFAGRPVSEYVGYPDYRREGIFKAAEGITVGGPMMPQRPDTFADMPEVDVPRASEPAPAPIPEMATSLAHNFAPDNRVYNKNTKIDPSEITVVDGSQMDPDLVLNTLASTERGRTGHGTNLTGPQGQKASALGIWGLTKGTRDGLYNKYFKNQMTKSDFDNEFTNNPDFERIVAKSLVEELLPKYGSLVFGAWYYPQYAEQYIDGNTGVLNKVPRADYGNAITWGGYVKKAQDRYFKMAVPKQQPVSQMPTFEEGGEYELDDDQIKQILEEGGEIEYL